MSIIFRFANRFFKSRVINHGLNAQRLSVELIKGGLENPEEKFQESDAMTFYEAKFYSHIARNWNLKVEPYEVEQYQIAKASFEEFESITRLISQLQTIYWEYRCLYLDITKELTSHNFWNRTENTNHTYEHNLQEAIGKYTQLLDQLKDYPEWQEHVKNEIGYYIHLIYNSTQHSDSSKDIFNSFDKHYFFK